MREQRQLHVSSLTCGVEDTCPAAEKHTKDLVDDIGLRSVRGVAMMPHILR